MAQGLKGPHYEEPTAAAYVEDKHLVQSFTSIERCHEAMKNIEERGHPHKKEMLQLVEARIKVLDFDAGRPFAASL